MILIELIDVQKSYGDRLILSIPKLSIYKGDKIGIVGPNGAGKTTFLNLISGRDQPDTGICRRYCDIAYIRQFSAEQAQADAGILSQWRVGNLSEHAALSGGEHSRIKIANALGKESSLLLADEPTANLDSQGIQFLSERLGRAESLMLISHDRHLLEHCCHTIWEIRDGAVKVYGGSYAFYAAQAEQEQARAYAEYEQYTAEKERLISSLAGVRANAGRAKRTPSRMGNSEARLGKRKGIEAEGKVNRALESIRSRIERLEVKHKPREQPVIRLDFSLTHPPANKVVLSGEEICFQYPGKTIFCGASFTIPNGTKTALIGLNGTGKTTLLNLIVGEHTGIRTAPKAKLGYLSQNFDHLDPKLTILQNALKDSVQNEEAVRRVLARLLFRGDTVFKKAGVLSGGEKVKLSLCKLLVSTANVLLLDEPTNYLDMDSIEAVQHLLSVYEGTLVFVSHDRALVDAVATRLLFLQKDGTISTFENGNLSDYEAETKPRSLGAASSDKMILEMRLAKIISELSAPNADREALEKEYADTLAERKRLFP